MPGIVFSGKRHTQEHSPGDKADSANDERACHYLDRGEQQEVQVTDGHQGRFSRIRPTEIVSHVYPPTIMLLGERHSPTHDDGVTVPKGSHRGPDHHVQVL